MKRKFLAGLLALAMAVNPILSAIPAPVAYAAGGHEVTAQVTETGAVIGNDMIQREFSTADGKLVTTQITNKRANNIVFTPGAGSEEFIIRVAKDPNEPAKPAHPALPRDGWTAEASSRQNAEGDSDGPAQNLLDGRTESIWHTNYGGGQGPQEYPHHVIVDMKGDVTFQCFSYTPRQQGEDTNGNIKGYQLWTTDNAAAGADDASWVKRAEGEFKYDGVNPIYVNLNEAVTAKKVKLVATSAKNGQKFAGGAEFNLHAEPYAGAGKCDREFGTSALTLNNAPVVTEAAGKPGKMITFTFAPYEFKGVTYTITENVVMYDGDHFMRKFLTISVPTEQKELAVIDYIDLESLKVPADVQQWTIPHVGGIVAMEEFKANLGQPIYVQGMFFGSEFPVTDNQIAEGTGYIRYYTGKNFAQLERDNQLVKGSANTFMTWQTVAGAARSTEQQVIQADFFEYIKTISQPTNFRLQYNSWFDNMMKIDDASIWKSFIEVDRELNNVEMRPLDSYVADDGWNNYNNHSIVDPADNRSGNTLNKTGFWEFNSKFPDEFHPASELVQNFGSSFGTWVGPRGGYNFYGSLADILTEHGTGSKAGGSVDVADRVYLKHFQDMAIRFQNDFGINYWKWDGFADGGQYNEFGGQDGVPVYNEAHHHMTGGAHHMYHVTDLWEGWTDLIENVRANAVNVNNIDDLWISLTCYTNPSPWFLQWGNSVWLQCVYDQKNADFGNSHLDKQMTYRDAMYYDFVKNHQFQFPLANVYNHDPVYGVEGTGMNKNTATDENFQNYLYMMSTRGNAFWELHYSDSIMTPGKYEVTSEFARWAEANYHMLKNSKMIGGMPDVTHLDNGSSNQSQATAYGYACFDGTDGIISMRNPVTTGNKTIEFTFDRTMGVAENCGELQYHVEHSYNAPASEPTKGTLTYGQKYSFTLQPNEVLILRVSQTGDVVAPTIKRAYTDGKNTVTVKFSEKVNGNDITIEGKNVTVAKSADDITYHLTVDGALRNGEVLTIKANGITDLNGNALAGDTITTKFYKNNLAAQTKAAGEVTVLRGVDLSDDGFTVTAVVPDGFTGEAVSATNYKLGVQDGHAYFSMNGNQTATSKQALSAGKHTITGVKENNGLIKIYVDGAVAGSAYDQNNRYTNVGVHNVGVMANVAAQVYSAPLGYNQIATLGEHVIDTTGMTVTGVNSDPNEGSVNNLFDGDNKTFWASAPGTTKIAKGNPSVTIDMGEEYVLEGIDYTQRFDAGQKWNCTGNLKNIIVETSMDNETWTEAAVKDTVDGMTEVRFAPVSAQYVRISGTKSYHWQAEKADTVMAVSELKLYGEKPVVIPVDPTDASRDYEATASTSGSRSESPLANATDNNPDTFWSTDWTPATGGDVKNRWIQLDLGAVKEVAGVRVLPRQGNKMGDSNGTPIKYSVQVSDDGTNWTTVAAGERPANSQGWRDWYVVELKRPVKARYVRYNGLETYGDSGNNAHMALAEIHAMKPVETIPAEVTNTINLIDAIGAVTIDSEAAVEAARAAYDALTPEQQKLVTNLADLEAAEAELAKTFEWSSSSLALSGEINLRILANFTKACANKAVVDVKLAGQPVGQYTVKDMKPTPNGYEFTVPVAARQMAEKAVLTVLVDGEPVGEPLLYSVRDYADNVLNGGNEYVVNLVRNMLYYGAQMQTFKGEPAEKLATNGLDMTDLDAAAKAIQIEELDAFVPVMEGKLDAGLKLHGVNLDLKNKTNLRYFFEKGEGFAAENYTFKVGEKVLTAQENGNLVMVQLDGISANYLDEMPVLTVTGNGKTMTVKYGPLSYARTALKGKDAGLQNVARGLILYNRAADAPVQ